MDLSYLIVASVFCVLCADIVQYGTILCAHNMHGHAIAHATSCHGVC